jgi:hypothetical protein
LIGHCFVIRISSFVIVSSFEVSFFEFDLKFAMAEKDPIPDPKEATEAKLCAYLEGELSPTERVEIEQHLAANPQHRQLLVDLAKTRDWMRSIPRETSPVDLGEVFQSHVERAMLLDDSADQSSGMSLNRWPQYVLVAAITVLTLGLGAVLVAILKSPQQNGPLAGTFPTPDKALVSPGAPATASVDEVAGKRTDAPVAPLAGAAMPAPLAAADADATKAPARLMGGRAREKTETDALKLRLAAAGVRMPVDHQLVCFVVSADSPPAAMEQVRGFFDRQQIALDVTPNDKLEPANLNNALQGNGGGNGGGGVAFGNSRNGENKAETHVPLPGEQNLAGGTTTQNRQNLQQVQQSGQNELLPNNAPNTTANNTDNVALDKNSPLAPGAVSTGETYYIARGITPLQLEQLNANLVGNDLKQSVDRVTLVDATGHDLTKATMSPGTIAKGQTITVTIPQLVGPGIEKANVVKVADDGSINLPMIDPLQAAGASVSELQQRISEKYREANLIEAATVTVAVAAPPLAPATTPPSSQPAVAANVPTTRAAEAMKDQLAAPKAAPIAPPSTHPAMDLVDVVVVVQPSRFPAPATPATK